MTRRVRGMCLKIEINLFEFRNRLFIFLQPNILLKRSKYVVQAKDDNKFFHICTLHCI